MPTSPNMTAPSPHSSVASDAIAPVPGHISKLVKSKLKLKSSDGQRIDVWDLKIAANDSSMSNWARLFRQHYCLDGEIDELRDGTGLSRAAYLNELIFPDRAAPPGPSIRAGDFAELLISDYVEFVLRYWVPRGKFAEKASRNESVKGVDILGFRSVGNASHHPDDELLAFEVKAQTSGANYMGCLQKAIDDSSEDYLRRGTTLNATKRRLIRFGDKERALAVQRFQNASDRPYIYRSGAAAVLTEECFDKTLLKSKTIAANHNNQGHLQLIVVRGSDLMTLVQALYDRAANEA